LAKGLSTNSIFINMRNLKKLLLTSAFGLGLALFGSPPKADAACVNAYDVTYPSKFCDPQGFGSCARRCPGEQ
jgi:hypothetical protein